MKSNLPPGVTDRMIEEQANGGPIPEYTAYAESEQLSDGSEVWDVVVQARTIRTGPGEMGFPELTQVRMHVVDEDHAYELARMIRDYTTGFTI